MCIAQFCKYNLLQRASHSLNTLYPKTRKAGVENEQTPEDW